MLNFGFVAISYAELLDTYLACRTFGHAWEEFESEDLKPPPWGYRISVRCTRCTTQRHDIIDWTGKVNARSYVHPEGYKLAGQPGRAHLRLELVSRRGTASIATIKRRAARTRKAAEKAAEEAASIA